MTHKIDVTPPEWRMQAISMGWSDEDLEALLTVINFGSEEVPVRILVESRLITVIRDVPYVFRGIGGNGLETASVLSHRHVTYWRRYDRPQSLMAHDDCCDGTSAPLWCPMHGPACAGVLELCGGQGVSKRLPCRCTDKQHGPECADSYPAEKKKASTETVLAVSPSWQPPPEKVKRKKKGPLPGQQMLGIPSVPLALPAPPASNERR
jgi:hypothetical protein